MINVNDFLNLCTDDSNVITLFDCDFGEIVFEGTMHEAMMSVFAEDEVTSFDYSVIDKVFCLNICTI